MLFIKNFAQHAIFLMFFVALPAVLLAQKNIKVTGKVTSEKGLPVSNASVVVKNTQIGTTTDEKGEFSLNVPENATLVISAVNMQSKEVKATSGAILNISMKQHDKSLDEVVVVGYGTQKKINLTGAVTQVDGKVLENRPVTNALAALQGEASGLTVTRSYGQPGKEGWDVMLRGFNSVNGNNSPLVIVDGAPGTISTLNPNDIQSINVLKDAAAAAIYGAEASGGVLIITTKSGKNQKLKVEYGGIFTTNKPYNMPERNHSWVEAEELNIARNNAGQSNSWSDAQLRWFQSSDTDYLPNISNPKAWDTYLDINYIDVIAKKYTQSNQHNLSFSGGNDKSNYLFSLGYYDQDGLFRFGPDGTKRINARVNYNTRLSSKISLNARISYTNINTLSPAPLNGNQGANGDYGLFYNLYQTRTIYPVFLPKSDGSTAGSYDETKYYSGGSLTYADLKDGGSRTETNDRFENVFTLKADLTKKLSFRAIYAPQFIFNSDNIFLRTVEFWNRVGVATYLNQTNSSTKARTLTLRNNIQLLGDYDYKIKNHSFHFLGGYQYDSYRSDGVTAKALNLISNDLASLNYSADPATFVPGVADNIQSKVLISYFGRLNYNFDSRFLFEATLRRDASSQLAPDYRDNWFPSVSAGWNIQNENWFRDKVNFIDELKLRGSWGKLGNSSVLGNYDYIALLSRGGVYPFNNVINNSIYQGSYASTEKAWEIITTSDIGLDWSVLRRRLSGAFDYFVRENTNMLIRPTVPAIFGVTPAQRNLANLKSWGWEFELKWRDNIGKFNYFVNFNISDTKNKIVSYGGRNVYSSGTNSIIEGLPLNTIWGYKTDGYFQTAADVTASAFQNNKTGPGDLKYLDLNGDGKINGGTNTLTDHGDLVNLGETTPHYSYGLTIGGSWKGIDFSAFFQGVGQRKMLIYSYAALPYMESWRQAWKINNDYWTPENPNALFPRLYLGGTHNAAVSDKWAQNAHYIRFKNLQVGYTFSNDIFKKAGVSKVRVYFTGQDIWEKTGMWYKYYDPEQPNNSSFDYPFFRSYAVGLNVTF